MSTQIDGNTPQRPEMGVPRWLRIVVVILALLAAGLVFLRFGGAFIDVQKVLKMGWVMQVSLSLLILFVSVLMAVFCLIRGSKYLKPDCDEHMSTLIGRLVSGNPTIQPIRISQFGMWIIIVASVLPFSVFAALPNSIPVWMRIAGILLVLLIEVSVAAGLCLQTIPSTPDPHRGLYKWLDARTKIEFNEGMVFLVPYFEDVYLVNIRKRELSVEINGDLLVEGNADMRMRLQVPYRPDPTRLSQFVEFNEDDGVALQVIEVLKECLREFVQQVPTWRVSTRTVLQAVGRNSDGTIQREEMPDKYQKEPWEVLLGMREQIYPQLIFALTGLKETSRETVLTKARNNDPVADGHRWGIQFFDINLTTIAPTGRTKDAADKRSQEAAEQAAEVLEMTTESMMAMELINQANLAGYRLTYDVALGLVMEHKTARAGQGYTFPGLTPVLRELVTAFFAKKR